MNHVITIKMKIIVDIKDNKFIMIIINVIKKI